MYKGELAEKSLDYQIGHSVGGRRMGDFLIKELNKVASSDQSVRPSDIVSFLKKKEREWLQYCDEFGFGKDSTVDVDQFK